MRVNDEAKLSDTLVAVGFYYDRGRMMEATLSVIHEMFRQEIHGIRRFGAAALDLAQLARGDYGVFMELPPSPLGFRRRWPDRSGSGREITSCIGEALPIDRPSSVLATKWLAAPCCAPSRSKTLPERLKDFGFTWAGATNSSLPIHCRCAFCVDATWLPSGLPGRSNNWAGYHQSRGPLLAIPLPPPSDFIDGATIDRVVFRWSKSNGEPPDVCLSGVKSDGACSRSVAFPLG